MNKMQPLDVLFATDRTRILFYSITILSPFHLLCKNDLRSYTYVQQNSLTDLGWNELKTSQATVPLKQGCQVKIIFENTEGECCLPVFCSEFDEQGLVLDKSQVILPACVQTCNYNRLVGFGRACAHQSFWAF